MAMFSVNPVIYLSIKGLSERRLSEAMLAFGPVEDVSHMAEEEIYLICIICAFCYGAMVT